MLGIILVILVIVIVVGLIPAGPIAQNYGWYPSGGLGLILLILLILFLTGRL